MYLAESSRDPLQSAESALISRFEAHIRSAAFPCVGAKSALAQHQMKFLVVGDLRCPRDDKAVYDTVNAFARSFQENPKLFQSLVILFRTKDVLTEEAFETAMWARLQSLEAMDAARGHAYDPSVSPEVDAPDFSLSFAQEAFFIVGIHPGASRVARRFDVPALVFNAHRQFEILRTDGRYEHMRERILARDEAISGSLNPMLARHGEISEASQYSGRVVDSDWRCPMRRVHFDRVPNPVKVAPELADD